MACEYMVQLITDDGIDIATTYAYGRQSALDAIREYANSGEARGFCSDNWKKCEIKVWDDVGRLVYNEGVSYSAGIRRF